MALSSDRAVTLRLPSSEAVKTERQAKIAEDTSLTSLERAKQTLALRRFNSWLCYKDIPDFGWSEKKLQTVFSICKTVTLRLDGVKEAKCSKYSYAE